MAAAPTGIPVRKAEPAKRVDISTLVGIALAFSAILGGLILERGRVQDVAQITAALIVFGGTFGAVLVSFPLHLIVRAIKRLRWVFVEPPAGLEESIEEIVRLATLARRKGILSLEDELDKISDPYLRRAITLSVDGLELTELRKVMEFSDNAEESRAIEESRVLESAGGFAPTIGIIGAVLGLIQVMKNLADIEEVGHGIAVAFVATVYGVGLSNLFLLPVAQKIKSRAQAETKRRMLIAEGIVGIVEGLNPKLLRSKLEAFTLASAPPKKKAAAEETAGTPAPEGA
jgi:chemotaxis protein MotA